ncbi:MAG: pyridoxamine 5'-phosphate oxidase family protein [Halopenitus sp.]
MQSERSDRPGSDGEKQLQARFGTVDRAEEFYENALLDHLNERMRSFLRERRAVFVGCTNQGQVTRVRVRDDEGVDVLGPNRVAWDEPPNSDLVAQAETVSHATLLAIDWEDTTVGFHLNGRITVERNDGGPRCFIEVEEAYIHCAKHIPRLERDPHTTFDETRAISPAADLETLYDEFITQRIFFMLGSADANGETDISPRFGPVGFVQLTERGLAYPEYRGNGVHASLGNMLETGRACFTFLDVWQSGTALHVEGDVTLHEEAPASAVDVAETDKTKVWVELVPDETSVETVDGSAYSLVHHDPPWGTDDAELKRAGFFTATDGNT